MTETKSQNEIILAMLKSGKKVTPLTALSEAKTLRLSGRIMELRQSGLNIKTTMIKVGNKHVASYSLV